jgi:processive 1,2-diacylglycerol beta-glucosyltransferase
VTVLDNVSEIACYYAASDVVVLDPSGVQIAEAAATGAAMLLLDPLPGLGRYNCDYVLERGAARKIYEHRRVGEFLRDISSSKEAIERMKYRARAMGRPNAGMDIISWAMEKVDAEERQRALDAAATESAETEESCPETERGNHGESELNQTETAV